MSTSALRTFPLVLLLSAVAALGATEHVSQPIVLSPAEAAKEGCQLAAEILSLRPTQNTTNTGVMKIRAPKNKRTEMPVAFEVVATPTNFSGIYDAGAVEKLKITHPASGPNEYHVTQNGSEKILSGNQTMVSFAGTDFWVADLGLEFMFWPDQRLLRKELRRGQSCSVLESINPKPAAGAYSRVVSWVDIDSGGIINADAYDFEGKRLKEFIAKSVKKVRGQWELEEIEMNNVQTDSRTQILFDLGSK